MVRYLSGLETAALLLSLLVVGVSFGGSSPLVSSILESHGASEYRTGGVVAMLALGLALFSGPAGRLVDSFGPRPVNVCGLLFQGVGISGLGLALAYDERWLFAARFWLGLSASLTFVAAEYALLKGTRPSHRGRVMAAYGAAFGLGFMLGVFLSNRAYDRLGLFCFGVLGGLAAAVAPAAYWALRGLGRESEIAPGEAAEAATLPIPSLLTAFYGAVAYAVLDIAMTGTYPVEGQRLGLSRSQALDIVGWMAFGTISMQPFAGALADRFGNRRLLLALSGLGFVSAVAAGIASTRWLPGAALPAKVSFTLMGAAVGGIFPVSLALLGERTPPLLLSRANAAYSTVFGYASLVGPLMAAGFVDFVERMGLLGWAVPALALLTFGSGLPLALVDRRYGGAVAHSESDVIQDQSPLLGSPETESDGG